MTVTSENEITRRIPTELLCLTLLLERDMYGYEMVREIIQRSGSLINVNLSTIYTTLRRLSEKGYVSIYNEFPEKIHGRVHTYYHIEPAAIEYRQCLLDEYQRATHGVKNFFSQCVEIE